LLVEEATVYQLSDRASEADEFFDSESGSNFDSADGRLSAIDSDRTPQPVRSTCRAPTSRQPRMSVSLRAVSRICVVNGVACQFCWHRQKLYCMCASSIRARESHVSAQPALLPNAPGEASPSGEGTAYSQGSEMAPPPFAARAVWSGICQMMQAMEASMPGVARVTALAVAKASHACDEMQPQSLLDLSRPQDFAHGVNVAPGAVQLSHYVFTRQLHAETDPLTRRLRVQLVAQLLASRGAMPVPRLELHAPSASDDSGSIDAGSKAVRMSSSGRPNSSRRRVLQHMAMNSDDERRLSGQCEMDNLRFGCELCGIAFKRKSHLQEHMEGVHLKLKLHVCEQCGRSFSTRSNMRVHVRTVHLLDAANARQYACSRCNARFKVRDKLLRHERNVHR